MTCRGDDWMQTESADWNVERRQRAKRHHVVGCKRNFFVRFPERRLLKRFPRVDNAAGQRHLTAMPLERIGTHGQDDVSCVGLRSPTCRTSVWRRRGREHQQERSRVADSSRIETGRPLAPRTRRERRLSGCAWKLALKCYAEPFDDLLVPASRRSIISRGSSTFQSEVRGARDRSRLRPRHRSRPESSHAAGR